MGMIEWSICSFKNNCTHIFAHSRVESFIIQLFYVSIILLKKKMLQTYLNDSAVKLDRSERK